MKPVKIDLDYLKRDKDRHGNERIYVRRFDRKIRIREDLGSEAFLRAYTRALAELGVYKKVDTMAAGPRVWPVRSFGWLAVKYFDSGEFKRLDEQSQKTRRGVIEECLAEVYTCEDGSTEPIGNCPKDEVTPSKVKWLREQKAKACLPGAANNRRKYLSAMFGWAIEDAEPALMTTNPARDIKRIKYATSGFHTWSREEVEQYRAHHAVGTKARLALEMLLFVGMRRGDLVQVGRQHRRGNALHFVPKKTKHLRERTSIKPILKTLAHVIDNTVVGRMTYLETEYGKPFTAKGFGNWFHDRCAEAGMPTCTAHGLRKIGATLAAELGASVHMLMAMYDWETPNQAKPYTDAADRKRLAEAGMPLLEKAFGGGT